MNKINPTDPEPNRHYAISESGDLMFNTCLTIRQDLAAKFMAALLSNPAISLGQSYDSIAKYAIRAADSFIKVNNELEANK